VVPQLRAWDARYAREGLIIVGIHSPEFFWEKPLASVKAAVEELAISYPVVQDNDFAIWKRYGTRYWPTTVLVDRRGVVRYYHIGEGAYQEFEAVIQRLLTEEK
jgi:peroxiredoxin